ncbi:MAG: hypothetical protein NVSMB32_07790 [Actinomycetota bacterium]
MEQDRSHTGHQSRMNSWTRSRIVAVSFTLIGLGGMAAAGLGLGSAAGTAALNPQPIPPGRGGPAMVALNPQPIPPGRGPSSQA